MKYAGRGGHNFQSPGACVLLDETVEARKINSSVIKYLKLVGETTIDATPGNCTVNADLKYGTDMANKAQADLFGPIHLNNAYASYVGAIGCEIWLNPKNTTSVEVGTRVINNLAALGFKNRGLKDGLNQQHLHDIRASNMPAILVEVCFVEATEDVRIYKETGADRIGKAIAEGILGHAIETKEPVTIPVSTVISVPATRVNNSIAQLQGELNNLGSKLLLDGFYGPKTLAACPIIKFGAQGNVIKWLQKRLALKLQDGIFGNGTLVAVKNYQTALGLVADGVVGKNTWDALLR